MAVAAALPWRLLPNDAALLLLVESHVTGGVMILVQVKNVKFSG
jgi:hypothetical protein